MKKQYSGSQSLRRNQQGVAAIEFAIVAPVFFFILFSIIELGLVMFSATVIESATSSTSRSSRLGSDGAAGDRVSYIREQIRTLSLGLIDADRILITTDLTTSYEEIDKPERCLVTPMPPIGTCPPGAPFDDTNGNGAYDGNLPALSIGSAGDIVRLRVYYPWTIISPLVGAFMSDNGEYIISSTTMVKNEEF